MLTSPIDADTTATTAERRPSTFPSSCDAAIIVSTAALLPNGATPRSASSAAFTSVPSGTRSLGRSLVIHTLKVDPGGSRCRNPTAAGTKSGLRAAADPGAGVHDQGDRQRPAVEFELGDGTGRAGLDDLHLLGLQVLDRLALLVGGGERENELFGQPALEGDEGGQDECGERHV